LANSGRIGICSLGYLPIQSDSRVAVEVGSRKFDGETVVCARYDARCLEVTSTMNDTVSAEARSRIMSSVRSKDTRPELFVRRSLHAAGYRFRLHRNDLPGRPDVVLPRFRTAVFVNGCFWHGDGCKRGRRPASNAAFWAEKIDRNISRDRSSAAALEAEGWRAVTIWECRLNADTETLLSSLADVDVPTSSSSSVDRQALSLPRTASPTRAITTT
jgi:DNA mismatch endonuclease (patch repair protein)